MAKDKYNHLYNSRAWKLTRKYQLNSNPLCKICNNPASVVDHVIAHRGNEKLFFHGELQSLCATCHNSYKQRFEKSGKVLGFDENGNPVDPNHIWNKK